MSCGVALRNTHDKGQVEPGRAYFFCRWVGFDKAVAVPSVMPKLLKIAKILGPKKLMPSPKSGRFCLMLDGVMQHYQSRPKAPTVGQHIRVFSFCLL